MSFHYCILVTLQMKPKHKKVILKAMSFIVMNLEVDPSLLSEFQTEAILDTQSIEEIEVS